MRRAKATMARFAPRRRATCAAHVLSHVEQPPIVGKTVQGGLLKRPLVSDSLAGSGNFGGGDAGSEGTGSA